MNMSLLATRFAGSTQMFWKKNGATVLTSVGIAAVPAAMALTGVATVKLYNALPDIKKCISATEDMARQEGKDNRGVKQDVARAQLRMGLQVFKIYSPAIATGSVSVCCLILGHNMMRKREAQLVGTLIAMESAFRAYRARVAEKLGAEEEQKLFQQPPITIISSEDGDSCIIDWDATKPSIYTKYFDEFSTAWSKDPEYNLMFLRQQENWANDKLRAQGHLFLNEVYDALGLTRTQAGNIVGWMADANEKGTGNGFIDFGIYQIHDDNNRAFVNGHTHTVGLDFNCDGVILDRV